MTQVWHLQCRHCGMITDNPTIVPHPDKDKEFREMQDKANEYLSKGIRVPGVYITEGKYNHSITCPVCENETRFWRDEPFPTDVVKDVVRITLRAAGIKIDAILQEEIDRAEEAGHKIKGIELPRMSHYKGIPITFYSIK